MIQKIPSPIVIILLIIFGFLVLGGATWYSLSKIEKVKTPLVTEDKPKRALTPSDLGWIIPETNPENVTTLPTGEEISSELISIIVKDNVSRQTVEEIANGIGGRIAGEIPDFKTYYIKFSPPKTGIEIKSIVDQLRQNPNIETASPDYILEFLPTETDLRAAKK